MIITVIQADDHDAQLQNAARLASSLFDLVSSLEPFRNFVHEHKHQKQAQMLYISTV
jgi:hypothetical protein